MKKRTILVIILALALCLSLFAACGKTENAGTPVANTGSSAPAAAAPADNSTQTTGESGEVDWSSIDPVHIKIGIGYSVASAGHIINTFDYIQEHTGGTVTYEIFGDGLLCDDSNTVDSIYDNVVQFGHLTASNASGYIPELGCLAIPGYYAGDDPLAFYEAIREPLSKIFESYGLHFFACGFPGEGAFLNKNHSVLSPDDLKGEIMRSSGSNLSSALEAWGAAASVITLPDTATALERNTVDGLYSSFGTIGFTMWYEFCDYVTKTGILETATTDVMSLETYNSLSPEQRAVVDEAEKLYCGFNEDTVLEQVAGYEKAMQDKGCIITELTEEQNAAFTDQTKVLFDEWGKTASDLGLELLKVIYEWNGWEWTFG